MNTCRSTRQGIPNCVPELYREQEEERDRRYDMAARHRARYRANRRKLDEAVRAGLPVLTFGGHGPCWECQSADHDTMTGDEDDICRVICRDPSCRCHRTHQNEEVCHE